MVNNMKKRLSFFVFIILLFTCNITFAQSNSFPRNTVQGNTEMGRNIRPIDVPNVNIEITQPQTGREVAFSVRLLILLTILTLAPSVSSVSISILLIPILPKILSTS